MALIQLPDGQWVEYDPSTGTVQIPDPFGPGSTGTTPATASSTGLSPAQIAAQLANPPGGQGGTAAFLPQALKWLAALVLLWIILTAMSEGNDTTRRFGQALSGLILMGALYYLGPTAIHNVQYLWIQEAPPLSQQPRDSTGPGYPGSAPSTGG